MNRLFAHYRAYTDGFLPYDGALTDQPNNLVVALQEISLAKAVMDNEDNEKAEDNGATPATGGSKFKSVLS